MPKTEYQHFINLISADVILDPKLKTTILKIFSPSKIGWKTVTSPGTRIYNSIIGTGCALGMGTVIMDSTVGNDTIVCAKAVVKNAKVGNECFIAANARVTGTIPDRTFVTGTNKCRKRDFSVKDTRRNIEKVRFEGYPIWDWDVVLKKLGIWKILALIPFHFITNSIAKRCKNTRSKTRLASIYCNVSDGATIHYSAILDPIFPDNIHVKKNAFIDKKCQVLAHSFVDEAGFVLEKGITVVGENSRVGADSVILPGVTIPDNVEIPPSSLVTISGPFLVMENRKLSWLDISK